MSASSRVTTGVGLLALVAIVDLSWPVLSWLDLLSSADAPPTPALLLMGLLGIVTLGVAQPARRGHRGAAWAMVGTRAVSVLFTDLTSLLLGAPAAVKVVTASAVVLTAVGIWWTTPLLGRGAPDRARARVAS